MMILGTFWTFCKLCRPLYTGIRAGIASARALERARAGDGAAAAAVPRTERDMDLRLILGLIVLSFVPLTFIFLDPSRTAAVALPMARHRLDHLPHMARRTRTTFLIRQALLLLAPPRCIWLCCLLGSLPRKSQVAGLRFGLGGYRGALTIIVVYT